MYLDERTGWTKNTKTVLTQITNKDMVSFDITEPHQRYVCHFTNKCCRNRILGK